MTDRVRDPQLILEDIRFCTTSADSEGLISLFTELETAILNADEWPSSFYRGIAELQGDRDFLRLDNSWKLLYFLNNNWERLSAQQRQGLRNVLRDGFDKYQNWMGAFVTSEILGERYADEDALATLTDLGKIAHLPARAAVPHGLETLARTTHSKSLRALAVEQLQELRGSDSEEVKQEALVSLQKLGGAGPPLAG
jgi:hypothetical protein